MDVKLPHLGEGADSGTVVNLFVKEGDTIEKNQPLLELENEKAVATIPSNAAGKVTKIFVKAGDKLSVGQRILSLSAGEPAAAPKPKAKEETRDSEPEPEDSPDEAPEPAGDSEPTDESSAPVAASPSIRRLARDLGIELARVRGSARGGRITLEDLRGYIQRLQRLAAQGRSPSREAAAAPARPAAESIDFSRWGTVTKKPFTSLRQVIARRMTESWTTIPHVTQFDEADITNLLQLRKKHADAFAKRGAKLTVTSFILKILADTLKKHPKFNSSLDEASQELVFKDYCHIGIAVDTEAGLIVPVLRDVDKKDLFQISKDLEDLGARARERKVSADELKGGSFTISNQGALGGGHFTPIVNKPEVAILGLGRGAVKAVAREKGIEARTMLPLALSYDHRVADGADAARFVVDLVKGIETIDEKGAGL